MMACVLLVEDERVVAEETARALRTAGHSVVGIAASGEQALALAQRLRPDLALVDIEIRGDMDGIELAQELFDSFGIAVVYVTGHAEPEVLGRATKSMPYGYVVKPFDERTLEASVEVALARHRVDQALREHGVWLSSLLRSIGVAVLATDASGRVRFANPIAATLADIDARVTRHVADCLRLEDDYHGGLVNPVTKALEENITVDFPANTVLVRKNGERVPVEGSVAPVRERETRPRGVVVAFRDIRERVNAEREQQRVQRLESLGTLAAGIAHDFNNMLSVIINSASLAKARSQSDPRLSSLLTDIEVSGERASALTAQLTAFAKGGTRSPQPMRLAPLVIDTVNLALRGSATSAEFEFPEDLPLVLADANQIGQVFTNLALNARDAMNGEGVIRVGARLIEVPARSDPVLGAGRYVEVAVRDQGVGIAQDNLERVFEPYFTTKESGSGLGLASSHGIVQQHGGTLRVESEVDHGSTFHVVLPVAESDEHSPRLPPVEPARTEGARILVMDDEADLRRVLGMCLEELGYEVALVPNGEQAIALYERDLKAGRRFDLVILDLTVPGGMGGVQTLERLKALDPSVRAIATTGYSESDVLASFAGHGFSGALPKPYRFATLAIVLREALGGAAAEPS